MLIFLFAASLGLVVFLLLRLFIEKKIVPKIDLSQRMRDISQESSLERQERPLLQKRLLTRRPGTKLEDIPFTERVLQPLRQYGLRLLQHLTPQEIRGALEHKLVLAGLRYRWTPFHMIGLMLACALLSGGVVAWSLYLGMQSFIQKFMAVLLAVIMGGCLPVLLLNVHIRKRQKKIFHQLPEALDLLSVSVEAGLSFDGALGRIVERMHGPLIDECRKMMGDMRMGMMRRTALQQLAQRCEVDEVSLFVTSVIQAERLGTSMGKTLQVQAENVRETRRQYIKGLALQAPVKIVFPLVFFIFPALLIVALGPPLLTLTKKFLGG